MICQKSADYRCCKNVADKPISDIWPIISASLLASTYTLNGHAVVKVEHTTTDVTCAA